MVLDIAPAPSASCCEPQLVTGSLGIAYPAMRLRLTDRVRSKVVKENITAKLY
jgi:hypothetical protein